jgi:alpha-tubulin suppressor-like RCC1 family protein
MRVNGFPEYKYGDSHLREYLLALLCSLSPTLLILACEVPPTEAPKVSVAVGLNHACALVEDEPNASYVKCWGVNLTGGLGQGDTEDRGDEPLEMGLNLAPVSLGIGRTAKAVSVGALHSCVLLDNDAIKCWGNNYDGELGIGGYMNRGDEPGEMGDNLHAVNLGTGRHAKALASGLHHNCTIVDNGQLKCWGRNERGQLGLGDTRRRGRDVTNEMGDRLPFIALGSGRAVKAIAAGAAHNCALLENGTVKCWGWNSQGALGLGDTDNRGDDALEMGDNLPVVDLGPGRTAKAISAGDHHTCAILDDGSLKCWGENFEGQLGLGDAQNRGDQPGEMGANLPAVNLGTGRTAKLVVAGGSYTCALLDNDSLKCWGYNSWGQLGLGDKRNRGDGPGQMGDALPAINLGTDRRAISVALANWYGMTCATLDDGGVKCWGSNMTGRLGLGHEGDMYGDEPGEMDDALPAVPL